MSQAVVARASEPRLRKEISMFGVYALSTGATLSAGLFLLPGLAAATVGPALVLCYLLAAIPLVPAMVSKLELATAMPRAGGVYYFLDRSLGPLAGTIGGLGTWLALTLKTAFALVGMGAYIRLFLGDTADWVMTLIAVAIAVLLGALNWLGARKTGNFQIVLVIGLLGILTWFIARRGGHLDYSQFEGFFGAGAEAILSTTGVVYISYVGITKVASVSEEIRNPERALPRAVFLSFATAVVVYGLCTTMMVGLLPTLSEVTTYTPMADAAFVVAGRAGQIVVAIGAILAFASVANAGILSSSRYPLAMGRDRLLPDIFRRLDRRGTPTPSILVTVVAVVLFILVLDPLRIAKLASAFQLLLFGMLCLAVIVMRESRIASYDPGYRSPCYPWMQIAGIVLPLLLITAMGWLSILFSAAVIALGALWFRYYVVGRVQRHGAVYHVFERLGRLRFEELDVELREIMKEKGLRDQDPFDQVVARAAVLDLTARSFDEVVHEAADRLAERVPATAAELYDRFMEGTRIGATPVTGGIALPHLRLPKLEVPELAIVRCREGIRIDLGADATRSELTFAVFFLISSESDPAQHLRLLARLASRVDDDDFMPGWRDARDRMELKQQLMQPDRHLTFDVLDGTPTAPLAGRALRDIAIPEGCLIALIHRKGDVIVPSGSTVFATGDRVTTIGSVESIEAMHDLYGAE